jgi:hypothetical protein
MATTTNYSWTTPDDTDLVKDGAAAIRTLGSAIDTSFAADQGDLLLGGTSDIFEPLAIGAAATVLTSDGTTASWAAPASATLSVATFVDEKSSGTAGGTFTSGAWRTRDLQTTKGNTISGCSLSSNQIVLPAGTYNVQASACVMGTVNSHQLKIYNITDSADILLGLNNYYPPDDVGQTAHLRGSFTLAAQKTIELQHKAQTTKSTYGFGIQMSFGPEVYAAITIIKES